METFEVVIARADAFKAKHGKRAYDLAEHGLTKEGVRKRFKSYIETYDIPVRG